jgi:MHS family proline/betaine transporter-like MFS transporter
LASGSVWLCREVLGVSGLADWGWRLPFLLGLVVAVFGLWLRREIPETISAEEVAQNKEPIGAVVRRYWADLLSIIGVVTGANVALYLVFFFAGSVASEKDARTPVEALTTLALVFMLPFIPLGGWWSDRRGRRPVSLATNLAILLMGLPVLSLCFAFTPWPGGPALSPTTAFLVGQLAMAVPVGLVYGVQGAMVAELLPKGVRCMVFSVAYGLAMALFAGSAPMISEWMIHRRGWTFGPLVYMALWSIIALISVLRARETHRAAL